MRYRIETNCDGEETSVDIKESGTRRPLICYLISSMKNNRNSPKHLLKVAMASLAIGIGVIFSVNVYALHKFHPQCTVEAFDITNPQGERAYYEFILYGYGGEDMTESMKVLPYLPLHKAKRIGEFLDWEESVSKAIDRNIAPLKGPEDIRITGKMEKGETYIKYSGFYTNIEGKKIDFNAENTFPVEICDPEDFKLEEE